MRSEMETSNGLFQQQNQTQMAVDNDITMFTQATHIPQNNNLATNTATTTIINNNETVATPSVAAVATTLVGGATIPPATVSSGGMNVVSNMAATPIHETTPTPTTLTVNRLHSVLSNSSSSTSSPSVGSTLTQSSHLKSNHQQAQAAVDPASQTKILTKTRLQELVREVDATEQLDDDVEEILLQLADDFVETTVTAACMLAKHRKASTVEVKDVQLHLERNWNMWIPGFGTDELRPYKRSAVTEAHKQRLALIRKTLKKY